MTELTDRATQVETIGIEFVPPEKRHGSAGRSFTLWFAANLTIADYVIGFLVTTLFGMTFLQALPVLIVGNVLGGLLVGLSAAMGQKIGLPQMFSSRASFGRKGNYPLGLANWVSTVGWFTVNTILGTLAIQAIDSSVNYYIAAAILVVVQVLIGIFGHDFIHLFEKIMSIVLGILFLAVFVLAIPELGKVLTPSTGGSILAFSLGAAGTTLASSFSYIMSWSPYASDYSRYLPESTSKSKVVIYTLVGGAVASFAVEALGALVGALAPVNSDSFIALRTFSGNLGYVVLVALVFGAIAANSLNIYTNSLSALVLDVKTKRWKTVVAGGVIGLVLSLVGGANFALNFQNFLLILDYWITPWLAIILVDFYLARRTSTMNAERAPEWDYGALGVYGLSILISVPFMSWPTGYIFPLASRLFQGADFSYFISFIIAAVLIYAYRKMKP
jgi:NCS1 family nucleobase:cation symporter-1